MNKKRHFLDFLGLAIIAFLVFSLFSSDCNAATCSQHKVTSGDTLFKLSQQYLGEGKRWREIKQLNGVRGTNIHVGSVLKICDTIEIDWVPACEDIIEQRLKKLGEEDRIDATTEAIIKGTAMAAEVLETERGIVNSFELLQMCRFALVTAQQESNFQFAIGAVGELGIYQFRADTARLTYSRYGLGSPNMPDEDIVRRLLDPVEATVVFQLHFAQLRKRYHSLNLSWLRYNGSGEAARMYAQKALDRYRQVLKIKPHYNYITEKDR